MAAAASGLVSFHASRRGYAERLASLFRMARGPMLWLALGASLVVLAGSAWAYYAALRGNAVVGALAAGTDIGIDVSSAPDAVILARAHYLLVRDRLDEAQTLADMSAVKSAPATQAALLYNLANARLRTAIQAIEQGALDKAIAQVNLAKNAYRRALRIDPGDWDTKFNLDVAMRLVRDLPQQEDTAEEESLEEPKQLWTDLPGIPKGLP